MLMNGSMCVCDHYMTEDKYDHLIQNPSSDP